MTSKLQKIHAQGAGIDVGSRQFFVGIENEEVKSFDTFTSGCHQVVEYLQQHSVTSVAMEATGVYWITLYDMLMAVGISVDVVNGRHVKHVPGRKTDVKDCMLHAIKGKSYRAKSKSSTTHGQGTGNDEYQIVQCGKRHAGSVIASYYTGNITRPAQC